MKMRSHSTSALLAATRRKLRRARPSSALTGGVQPAPSGDKPALDGRGSEMSVRRVVVCVTLIAAVLAVLASTLAAAPKADRPGNPNPGVVPLTAKVGGLSYSQWGDRWWQWAHSVGADESAITDMTGGPRASAGQSWKQKVFFLCQVGVGQPVLRTWRSAPRQRRAGHIPVHPNVRHVAGPASLVDCTLSGRRPWPGTWNASLRAGTAPP